MAAQIFSIFGRSAAKRDWSQQEIAEFYRVESALIRAGIRVGTDRGISDEGDPWFVFFRADDGEVVIHLARIDGEYVLAGSAYQDVARGADFQALVGNLIANHPMVRSDNDKKKSNILMHPAAMLIAIIGTAFFKSGDARADDGKGDKGKAGGGGPAPFDPVTGAVNSVVHIEVKQAIAILASVLMAMEMNADNALADTPSAIHPNAAGGDHPQGGSDGHAPQPISSDAQIAMIKAAPDAAPQVIQPLLALIAVLHDLPPGQLPLPGEPQSAHAPLNPAPILAAAAEREATATANAAPEGDQPPHASASSLDAWLLEISLKPESLPDIAALRLVKEVAFGQGEQISLVRVDALPSALAQLIASGLQVGDDDHAPAPGGGLVLSGDLGTLPVILPPADQGHGDGGVVQTPSLPVATPDLGANVGRYLAYFIAHTNDFEVIVTGDDIVIVDDRVMASGYSHNVDSVTFHLNDGSSISLVGQSAVIHDTLTHFM
jgi:hypothetical protein